MICPVCDYTETGSKRSVEQLRRYHKLIALALDNWPEWHERQFASVKELRAWLQMKAGHREVGATMPISGMSKERALLLAEAAIRGAGSNAFPVLHGDTLVVFRPKSIAFAKMAHLDFCKLSDAVCDVIEKETGMRAEDLLRECAA